MAYNEVCAGSDFEILVIDDHSRSSRAPRIPEHLNFDVTVVTMIGEKSGINPSLPIEIGANHARGEVLVLSSPEIVPIRNYIPHLSQGMNGAYKVFDVFALTDKALQATIMDHALIGERRELSSFTKLQSFEGSFLDGLGAFGYPYANALGAWYQHHKYKDEKLHFLSAISRNDFARLGGFDLRFRFGAGYEDLDFRDRACKRLNVISVPGLTGIHLEHEEVSSRPEFKVRLNSNALTYGLSKLIPFGLRRSKRLVNQTSTKVRIYKSGLNS